MIVFHVFAQWLITMNLWNFQVMKHDFSKSEFENSGVHWDSNSQSGSSFGSVKVHFLTFSYTLRSMKCDSWASFLACTFVSLCFGHKPKVKVATNVSSSKRIFCGLMSIWTILGLHSWCKYVNLWIIPLTMCIRWTQSKSLSSKSTLSRDEFDMYSYTNVCWKPWIQ